MEFIFCTIVARNCVAQAMVLGLSIQAVDKKAKYVVLLADVYEREVDRILKDAPNKDAGFQFMCLDELVRVADYPELLNMALRYNSTEYCASLKPTLLLALARKSPTSYITYLDPDIKVYRPLYELREMIQHSSIVLTPHLIRSCSGPIINYVQKYGVYNHGLISTNAHDRESSEILEWWQERLRYGCLQDTPNGVTADQKWCDLFPCFGERVHVLKNPSYNIAHWNLHERSLTMNGKDYQVNSEPLAFFHFSGYSPHEPDRLSRNEHALQLNGAATLRRVVREYNFQLHANGFEHYSSLEYGFSRNPNNQERISTRTRFAYRDLIDNVDSRFAEDPFNQNSVWRLVNSPIRRLIEKTTRALKKEIFVAAKKFKAKLHKYKINSNSGKAESVTTIKGKYSQSEMEKPEIPGGYDTVCVGLFGNVTSESGVGEACRGLIRGYLSAKINVKIYDYRPSPSRKENKEFAHLVRSQALPMDIGHVCVNAIAMDTFFRSNLGQIASAAKYKIATWYWELEEFPDEWTFNQHYIDEIWAGSDFIANALKKKLGIPIRVIPPSVSFIVDSKYNRDFWGIPQGKKVVMSSMDGLSYLSRKNAAGIISTFHKLALTKGAHKYHFVLKLHNVSKDDERKIRQELKTPNVTIFNRTMTAEENYGLLACADAYVSLHRSEGLGLPILEAMKIGIPVVATGYSGNMDYMNETNSFLVPYKLVRVRKDGVYRKGYWAEPDRNASVELVEIALSDGREARERAKKAKDDIERGFSPEAIGERICTRLKEIRGNSSV